MAQLNDIVELADGSVGVVSRIENGRYHVQFFRNHWIVEDITAVLAPPTYSVGDEISVWPDLGAITAINGDTVSVDVLRADDVQDLGVVHWTGHLQVPLWRVIRDNDPRIIRIYE